MRLYRVLFSVTRQSCVIFSPAVETGLPTFRSAGGSQDRLFTTEASTDGAGQVQEETVAKVGERLSKMIARTGICGRREAENRIKEQRVTVNGRIVSQIGQRIVSTDEVWLDEHKIEWNRRYEKIRLWAVHKPRQELVGLSDNKNRRLLIDRLQDLVHSGGEIKPVNHLDFNTDGLILYSNNGRFARLLSSPAVGLTRVFRVKVHGLISESKLDGMKRGMVVGGVKYSSMTPRIDKKMATNTWMSIRCTDYKARQIPVICTALHLKPNVVTSMEFGPYKLGKIPLGRYKEVEVTPQLERMFYAATRRDRGLKTQQKNSNKKAAEVTPKVDIPLSATISDEDLDDIFIDNSSSNASPARISYVNNEVDDVTDADYEIGDHAKEMGKAVNSNGLDEKNTAQANIADKDNSTLLKKLRHHLKMRKMK